MIAHRLSTDLGKDLQPGSPTFDADQGVPTLDGAAFWLVDDGV